MNQPKSLEREKRLVAITVVGRDAYSVLLIDNFGERLVEVEHDWKANAWNQFVSSPVYQADVDQISLETSLQTSQYSSPIQTCWLWSHISFKPFSFWAISSWRMSSVRAFTRNSREFLSIPSTREATYKQYNLQFIFRPFLDFFQQKISHRLLSYFSPGYFYYIINSFGSLRLLTDREKLIPCSSFHNSNPSVFHLTANLFCCFCLFYSKPLWSKSLQKSPLCLLPRKEISGD